MPNLPICTDALVIGAGPVGLFQVFQLGLLELKAEVVDALPEVGGQCAQLYPDKPIYDIPGLPVASGHELVARLQAQAAPFAPGYHLGQLLAELQALPDGRWQAATHTGTRFIARSVFIAAGAGAFVPRTLALEGLEHHLGRQLHYQLPPEHSLAGQQVLILGDEDPALSQAIELAELPAGQRPARITLVHRREQFRADAALVQQFNALRQAGALHFVAGVATALVTAVDGQQAAQAAASTELTLATDARAPARLGALKLSPPEGEHLLLPMDTLLIRMGLSPRLGPLADWGLALQRRQVAVDTERFETSLPGVYAVGDINHYPGKRKLLLCGFHEATLAAYAAASRLRAAPVQLQYTTTSPRLHQLLGVGLPATGSRAEPPAAPLAG